MEGIEMPDQILLDTSIESSVGVGTHRRQLINANPVSNFRKMTIQRMSFKRILGISTNVDFARDPQHLFDHTEVLSCRDIFCRSQSGTTKRSLK
jgi:hypothetical protein